jgi:hypothetical protein
MKGFGAMPEVWMSRYRFRECNMWFGQATESSKSIRADSSQLEMKRRYRDRSAANEEWPQKLDEGTPRRNSELTQLVDLIHSSQNHATYKK